MSFWLRVVLSSLLALALPMQGVAAATMLRCGDGEGQAAHSAQVAQVAAMSQHHHHHAVTPGATSQSESPMHAAMAKCSVCAACCVGSVLPAASRSFDATTPPESFDAVTARVDPVFLTGGPERPPRPSIA